MIGRFFRRLLRWTLLGLFLAVSVAYYMINNSGQDPARWHVDPASVERSATPNDFLAAPPGSASAPIDAEVPVFAETPVDLLTRVDEVLRAQERVEVIAGTPDEGMITYVQRSRYVGFPDYITVKAVPVGEGASLILYSRSRYGSSDMGVNEARVAEWLAAIGPPA